MLPSQWGDAGVELGGFPGLEDEVLLTEHQPQPTVEGVEPCTPPPVRRVSGINWLFTGEGVEAVGVAVPG